MMQSPKREFVRHARIRLAMLLWLLMASTHPGTAMRVLSICAGLISAISLGMTVRLALSSGFVTNYKCALVSFKSSLIEYVIKLLLSVLCIYAMVDLSMTLLFRLKLECDLYGCPPLLNASNVARVRLQAAPGVGETE